MSSAKTTNIGQQLKSINHNNINLYQHIKKVISEVIGNNDELSNIEHYSFIKKLPANEQSVYKIREDYSKHLKEYQIKNRLLVNKLNIGTEEEPQQPGSIGYVPDLMEEARYFQKFGVGFGEDETYRIFKSLARFSLKRSAKQTKFWGKILGTNKDYYVIQANADSTQEPGELSPDTEPKGVGINKLSYFVCTDLTGQWSQLPIITPTQLQVSRKIKHLFSGDLNRVILSNPQFTGKQSHLCQIVRISTTCTIVPKGMFVLNSEDPKEIDIPQQYTFPDISYLASNENWVYHNVSILRNGRVSIIKPQGLQPEEEEKVIKKMLQKDPTEPRLKSIAMDNSLWALRSVGLDEKFKTIGKQSKIVSKGVIGVKSLLWSGWLTIAYSGRHSSIYVGYGQKTKQNYYPGWPETVLSQCQDRGQVIIQQ